MTKEDYDDPETEERWCEEQKSIVTAYLHSQGVKYGRVGDWPAWHVAPYVSIWAVESLKYPECIGWWVISGDLPTDCISSSDIKAPQHPRKAIKAMAERWLQYVDEFKKGEKPADYCIGNTDSFEELMPLLVKRANLLIEWAKDDSLWSDL
ncbi:DUF4826 family protein [Desulforegula conservatrix]|uniref:DUF4826 family protein n=1 Tax=Desulforegula conservatrix TaxID=153026 RepID=UPI0012EC4C87|nr:DUF4826 family protein [Desulforegula conservatrix]